MRAGVLLGCATGILLSLPSFCSAEAPPEAALATLDEVVVTGVQPGPGLWRVSNADGHVVWVLGTLQPLPARMEWVSREVEETLRESQELILRPTAKMDVQVGFFGALTLLPSALGARKNPEGARLEEVVPAEDYARWLVLKRRYLGRNRGVEKQRPLLAAQKLYAKAIRKSDLRNDDTVSKAVHKLAKRLKLTITQPDVEVVITDPRQALKEVKQDALDDLACFRSTLERLETDLGDMRARANAWATGDLEVLRSLPYEDNNRICANAFLNAEFARKRGLSDVRQRARAAWLAAVEKALARHASTVALVGIGELLQPDGVLAHLSARGYTVEAP